MPKLSDAPLVESVVTGSGSAAPSTDPDIISTIPSLPKSPVLSPSKALGLDELGSATDQIDGMLKKSREKAGLNYDALSKASDKSPVIKKTETEVNPASKTPAEPIAPKVEAVPVTPEPVKPSETDTKIADLVKQIEELKNKQNNPPKPIEPEAPVETPEQKAARDAQIKKDEIAYIQDASSRVDFAITPEEIESINAGGDDAIKALSSINKRAVGTAILEARKSMYNDMREPLKELTAATGMLLDHHRAVVQVQARQVFVAAHPDLAPHINIAQDVALRMSNGDNGNMPDWQNWWRQANDAQKIAAVAEQTENILNQRAISFGYQSWRQMPPPAAVAPPAAPSVSTQPPIVGTVSPAAPVPIIQPLKPVPRGPTKPPAAHAPGANSAPAGNPNSISAFNKSAAAEIR